MQALSVLSEDHGGNSQRDNISVINKNDYNFCCEKQRSIYNWWQFIFRIAYIFMKEKVYFNFCAQDVCKAHFCLFKVLLYEAKSPYLSWTSNKGCIFVNINLTQFYPDIGHSFIYFKLMESNKWITLHV